MLRTLSQATTSSQRGPGSEGNEGGAMHSSKLQHYWNLTNRLFILIPGHSLGRGSNPSAVGVFYRPNQQGNYYLWS